MVKTIENSDYYRASCRVGEPPDFDRPLWVTLALTLRVPETTTALHLSVRLTSPTLTRWAWVFACPNGTAL